MATFCIFSIVALSQTRWTAFNDSCFKQTKGFYDSCNQLTSNKPISADQVKIDRFLIKLINRIYNDSAYSLKKLEAETAQLKNKVLHQNKDSGKITIEFNANAEGNIYVSIKALINDGVLTGKQIYLATKTHVLCNNDQLYVNGLDFLYLRLFIKEINFPLALKPHQGNLDIGER